ncbi:MAG: hypothetical protein RL698_405 [Pseudomonadota bacterium]|jgi:hypothetical protein
MRWSRALAHWLVAALLAGAYFATRPSGDGAAGAPRDARRAASESPGATASSAPAPGSAAESGASAGRDDATAPPAAPDAANAANAANTANTASAANATAGAAGEGAPWPEHPTSIRIESRGLVVACRREAGGAWQVEEPAGKSITRGLLDAFAEQLGAAREAERIEGGAAPVPAEFGLDHPAMLIAWTGDGGRRGTLAIGDRTPTGTGAYARCGTAGSVRLVGLSLVYYAELLLSAAR